MVIYTLLVLILLWVANFTVERVKKGIKLYREVNRGKSFTKGLRDTCSFLFDFTKVMAITTLNRNVKKIDRQHICVSYIFRGKLYNAVIKVKNGPHAIVKIEDDKHHDVTHIVSQYLGPGEDWHHSKFNPFLLGYNTLTFHFTNGETKRFNTYETVEL